MTVGSMIVKRDPPMKCSRCEHEIPKGATAWYTKGKRGYWCQDCQDDWVQKNASGSAFQTGYATACQPEMTTTTTAATPTAEAARQSSTVPWSSFESDAAKGHRENMESARKTRDVLALLVTAIDQVRQALVDLRIELEAKR